MRNTISELKGKSREDVKALVKKGWKFRDGFWESHHNGTPYYDVEFKSPTMHDFASISEHDWPKVTKEYLFDREATYVARTWAENSFKYRADISVPVANMLKQKFLEAKSTQFGKLGDDAIEFAVNISPSIKNKPNKVKITIEIT